MRCPTWFVIGLLNLSAISAAGAVDRIEGVQIVPRNNGVSRPALAPVIPGATIVGNEIRLPKGGVTVELEFIVSGWENAGNELFTVSYPVDLTSMYGVNASPPQPGVDLSPVGYPANQAQGAFVTLRICQTSQRDCGVGQPACGVMEGICIPNERFIFIPEVSNPAAAVNAFPFQYVFNTAADVCLPDPGAGPDPIDYGYFGTLLLSIPGNAVGTFHVSPLYDTEFPDEISPEWAADSCPTGEVTQIQPNAVGASITILDCDQDGVSDGREIDLGSATDCNLNFIPDSCELADGQLADCDGNNSADICQPDTDGDGSIDACEACPGDPLKITPGVCGCGNPDVEPCDYCPNDPLKSEPGACGCGTPDEDLNGNGTPDCFDGIPAASTWGLVVLALMLMAGAKVVFARRVMKA